MNNIINNHLIFCDFINENVIFMKHSAAQTSFFEFFMSAYRITQWETIQFITKIIKLVNEFFCCFCISMQCNVRIYLKDIFFSSCPENYSSFFSSMLKFFSWLNALLLLRYILCFSHIHLAFAQFLRL